ncbi:LemA family protein [Candidatus Protochlamydia amoebophila]|nr:LemA family protein [Candidatus Protochlamydia amoebophila]
MATSLLILLGIVIVVFLWGMGVYNTLVRLRNQVNNAWGQIDVQLQRRYDLIPNLVEAVKGYMSYEKNTLEAVISARNQAQAARGQITQSGGPTESSASAVKKLVTADAAVRGAVTNIMALAENYPQLKASENMQQLQEELSSTENKVAFARQAYNDNVMLYNTAQQEFPAVLFVTIFGHHSVELFQIDDQKAKLAPKISFD